MSASDAQKQTTDNPRGAYATFVGRCQESEAIKSVEYLVGACFHEKRRRWQSRFGAKRKEQSWFHHPACVSHFLVRSSAQDKLGTRIFVETVMVHNSYRIHKVDCSDGEMDMRLEH